MKCTCADPFKAPEFHHPECAKRTASGMDYFNAPAGWYPVEDQRAALLIRRDDERSEVWLHTEPQYAGMWTDTRGRVFTTLAQACEWQDRDYEREKAARWGKLRSAWELCKAMVGIIFRQER